MFHHVYMDEVSITLLKVSITQLVVLLQNSRKKYNADSEAPPPWKWFSGDKDSPYKVMSIHRCNRRMFAQQIQQCDVHLAQGLVVSVTVCCDPLTASHYQGQHKLVRGLGFSLWGL